MRTVPIEDVLALEVPPQWRQEAEAVAAGGPMSHEFSSALEQLATYSIAQQYAGRRGLRALTMGSHDWLITRDPQAVEDFQPGDGCASCIAGNDQARAFLREHPDALVVLGNLHYVEVWND